MEEMNMVTNEEFVTEESNLTEVENSVETTELVPAEEEKDYTKQIVVTGIAIGAAAGYGVYRLGKDHVVPACKKGLGWIKGKLGKKNKVEEDFEDDFYEDDFEEENN